MFLKHTDLVSFSQTLKAGVFFLHLQVICVLFLWKFMIPTNKQKWFIAATHADDVLRRRKKYSGRFIEKAFND